MKSVAVITDIHGNLPALEAALTRIEEVGPEKVYCCGDLVGYGPWPNEVCQEIEDRGIPTIYGNYMRGLPFDLRFELEGKRVRLVHGSPRKVNEYLFEDKPARTFERIAADADCDILVFGHTHKPWISGHGRVVFVNCGSVGNPEDGDPRGASREVAAAGLPAEFAEKLLVAA